MNADERQWDGDRDGRSSCARVAADACHERRHGAAGHCGAFSWVELGRVIMPQYPGTGANRERGLPTRAN